MRRQTRQAFSVPNNLFGRVFIWALKRWVNRATYEVVLRGRGGGRARSHGYDTPIKGAKRIGIYLNERNRRFHYPVNEATGDLLNLPYRRPEIIPPNEFFRKEFM